MIRNPCPSTHLPERSNLITKPLVTLDGLKINRKLGGRRSVRKAGLAIGNGRRHGSCRSTGSSSRSTGDCRDSGHSGHSGCCLRGRFSCRRLGSRFCCCRSLRSLGDRFCCCRRLRSRFCCCRGLRSKLCCRRLGFCFRRRRRLRDRFSCRRLGGCRGRRCRGLLGVGGRGRRSGLLQNLLQPSKMERNLICFALDRHWRTPGGWPRGGRRRDT